MFKIYNLIIFQRKNKGFGLFTTAKLPCAVVVVSPLSLVRGVFILPSRSGQFGKVITKITYATYTHTTTFNAKTFISTFVRTALSAEWQPADGSKWVEKDFEKDIQKLEKEAEERLDKKIAELKENIATVGKP